MDDAAAAGRWSDILRTRAATDVGVLRYMATGVANLMLPSAAYLGMPEWGERIAATVPADAREPWLSHLLAAGSAFFAGDSETCGREVGEYYARMLATRWGAPPPALLFARGLRRAGVQLGPDWDRALGLARQYLEHARADWLLGELAKIEA